MEPEDFGCVEKVLDELQSRCEKRLSSAQDMDACDALWRDSLSYGPLYAEYSHTTLALVGHQAPLKYPTWSS